MSNRLLAAGVGFFALFAALSADAGMESDCSNPIVSSKAKVQVFILPFRADGPLGDAGRDLGTVLQRQILFSALKYTSIAVEQLTDEDGRCEFDDLSWKVEHQLKPGQVALYLQGRLFQQDEIVYVQTTFSSKTMGFADRLLWDGGANAPMETTTPGDPVAFQARAIPARLASLDEAHRWAMRLHEQPSENSPADTLPSGPHVGYAFVVDDTRGNWMHVQLVNGGMTGWLSAELLAPPSELGASFPELFLVDGAIGYYGLEPMQEKRLAQTTASLERYLVLSADYTESSARALAAILLGNAKLRASPGQPPSLDTLRAAERDYAFAHELSPQSSAATGFYLASAAALCARKQCPDDVTPARIRAGYLEAIGRDPSSPELLGNLKALYLRAKAGVLSLDLTKAAVTEELGRIERVELSPAR